MIILRAGLVATMGLFLACAMTATAWAHAAIVGSTPTPGQLVSAATVEDVELRFSQPVAPVSVVVVMPEGEIVDATNVTQEDERILATLPALGQGTHVISWRVVSIDGHPIAGTIPFSVGFETTPQLTGPTIDPSVRIPTWIARTLLYVGLFVGAGGVMFHVGVLGERPDRTRRRRLSAILWMGLATAAVSLLLQGLDLRGASPWRVFDGAVLRAAVQSTYAWTIAAAVVAIGLALLALRAPGAMARLMALLSVFLIGVAFASSGHAAPAAPQIFSRGIVFAHALSVAFWIGALWPLADLLRDRDGLGPVALRRFSDAIPWALALLLASGAALAVLQLGAVADLWATPYGLLLSAKLICVAALLGLALYNRVRLTPSYFAGAEGAVDRFRHSIQVEMILILVIFALVALWRFVPPDVYVNPVTQTPQAPPTFEVSGNGYAGMAMITIQDDGCTSIAVDLSDADGLAEPMSVTITSSPADGSIAPIERDAEPDGEGIWQAVDFPLPRSGQWDVSVSVLISDFDLATLHGQADFSADGSDMAGHEMPQASGE